jgi:hypothetical protein
MKNASLVVAILFTLCLAVYAQPNVTGTWRVEGVGAPFPWEAVLQANGSNVIGAVSTSSLNVPSEIVDGHINGNTISFKFNPFDGRARMIVLSGKVDGDEITFTWEARDPARNPLPAADRMFGTSSPLQFVAKRVPDANDAIAIGVMGIPIPNFPIRIQATIFTRIVWSRSTPILAN